MAVERGRLEAFISRGYNVLGLRHNTQLCGFVCINKMSLSFFLFIYLTKASIIYQIMCFFFLIIPL